MSMPSARPVDHVDEADAAGVVEVERDRQLRHVLPEIAAALGDQRRRRHAGGVAEPHALHAEIVEAPRDVADPGDRHVALERAAERGRDRALDRDPGLVRDPHHVDEAFERFLDRAVDVLPVVALGGRDEHADLVDAGLGGALGALGVRHQRSELRALGCDRRPPAPRPHRPAAAPPWARRRRRTRSPGGRRRPARRSARSWSRSG